MSVQWILASVMVHFAGAVLFQRYHPGGRLRGPYGDLCTLLWPVAVYIYAVSWVASKAKAAL